MKVLLTGVTGYIGGRLLATLLDDGHEIYACVRDKARFPRKYLAHSQIHLVEVDFLRIDLSKMPTDFDVAFYLIHSMTTSLRHFDELEIIQAQNFVHYMTHTSVKQVIYLSGIAHDSKLSVHLASRKQVEKILVEGPFKTTVFHAAIIVGAGSASFEIMYDLVEKLPLMVGPDSLNNECQPIGIANVIYYLKEAMLKKECMGEAFDIGGPQILSYRDMICTIANVRRLKRRIITIPWISAKFCAHWFYFITSVSYNLAVNLSNSMQNKEICRESKILTIIPQKLLTFRETVEMALMHIAADNVLTSWKDSFSSSGIHYKISDQVHIPQTGVLRYGICHDSKLSKEQLIHRIWETGGVHGWWYANWLWKARGVLDLLDKGIGMRGRTSQTELYPGEAIDYWRVIIADKKEGHLLLYAEMVMPGQGWIDFKVQEINAKSRLCIEATFRPRGIKGRLYWSATKPFHYFIFKGMIRQILKKQ